MFWNSCFSKFESRTWKNSKLSELWCELVAEWTTLMSRSDTMRNMRILLCQHKPIIKKICTPYPSIPYLTPIDCKFISFSRLPGKWVSPCVTCQAMGLRRFTKNTKKTILKIIKKEWYRKIVIYIIISSKGGRHDPVSDTQPLPTDLLAGQHGEHRALSSAH